MLRIAVAIWLVACAIVEIQKLCNEKYKKVHPANLLKVVFLVASVYYILE